MWVATGVVPVSAKVQMFTMQTFVVQTNAAKNGLQQTTAGEYDLDKPH